MGKTRKNQPARYYSGLTQKQKTQRRREIAKYGSMGWKDPKAYVGFKTDAYGKRKTSNYTKTFRRMFPDAKSLKEKANATGVPEHYLRESYNRGLAAWRTGHRPGATEQQWGYARVHSLLVCGKTYYGPDADIVKRAKSKSKKAAKWFAKC